MAPLKSYPLRWDAWDREYFLADRRDRVDRWLDKMLEAKSPVEHTAALHGFWTAWYRLAHAYDLITYGECQEKHATYGCTPGKGSIDKSGEVR